MNTAFTTMIQFAEFTAPNAARSSDFIDFPRPGEPSGGSVVRELAADLQPADEHSDAESMQGLDRERRAA